MRAAISSTAQALIVRLPCIHAIHLRKKQRNPWSTLLHLGRRAQRKWKSAATSIELIQGGRR